MGVIICYIDSDFNLIYKLVGFENVSESHTGIYLFAEFEKIISAYPAITLDNIFR